MLISTVLTIPSNTIQSSPYSTVIKVPRGYLTGVKIQWRAGSGSLCGIRVYYQEVQIIPYNIDEWIPSTASIIEWGEMKSLSYPPRLFEIQAYNTDIQYAHKVWIAFEVSILPLNVLLLELGALFEGVLYRGEGY